MLRRSRLAPLLPLLVVAACATGRPPPRLRDAAAAGDARALGAAAEAFYAARTPAASEQAVAAARAAGPESALAHELAAELARLRGEDDARFDHLEAALLDPGDDAALLHLHQLDEILFSLDQAERAEALYRSLVARHPSAEVRAAAAYKLAGARHLRADAEGRDAALAALGHRLRFAIVGAWDNDQGKGFDQPFPPEERLDLSARYEGSLLSVGWRVDPPADPRGRLDLSELVAPATWAVAYAVAAVQSEAGGPHELRLGTSDPVKVWVNGALVHEARRVDPYESDLFDQLVVPVQLRPGANRILVKSAQQTGGWSLLGRVTGPGGAPAEGLAAAPFDAVAGGGAAPGPARSSIELVQARVAALPEGSMRRGVHAVEWARRTGARLEAIAAAEGLASKAEDGLVPRWLLAAELWEKGERGRASDLLTALDAAGDALPSLRLARARFLQQQGMKQTARKTLLSVKEKHATLPAVWFRLAEHFRDEGWNEDRCDALATADRLRPGVPLVRLAIADCQEDLGFASRATAIYDEVARALPAHGETLRRLAEASLRARELGAAARWAERRARSAPHLFAPQLQLAEIRRREGDLEKARAAIERALAAAADAAGPHKALGKLRYQAGDKEGALVAWQAALERDPKDEGLAHRLEFLAPPEEGAWAADIPDEAALDRALALRGEVKPLPGADVIYLLDHDVTHLKADGSTSAVVTQVAHAVNQAGRDRLTKLFLQGAGRTRLLAAYAVDPQGRRSEAASIRGRTVHFRGLSVGSTVVLQYRRDAPPVGYLAKHLTQVWWFQGPQQQHALSQWVLWAPQSTRFHETKPEGVVREEKKVGDEVRVSWSARDTAPLLPEPRMPTARESSTHLLVSTVPTWETYLQWEQALLEDAFRESPELLAFADGLLKGADTAAEKVARIQQFLVDEVRYQQDYEDHIAGVKPHPAPMTLERGYGDCKDKAVLFITLARRAGVDARFALVRTRDAGPVEREVPMQQFNHAIVYVPAQPGIAAPHFYDPTADALDVDATRTDDPGTLSLVYDPTTRKHEWLPIPFQPPSTHLQSFDVGLALDRDGSAKGALALTSRGVFGSELRKAARNSEKLAQAFRQMVGDMFAGGALTRLDVVEAKDLRKPAALEVGFAASSLGRREGDELRLKVPVAWSPRPWFALAERKHPLVLGVPAKMRWRVEVALPEGGKVKRLPAAGKIESRCLTLSRTPSVGADGKVVVEQELTISCERIPAAEYPAHRAQAEAMLRLLDEELVVDVAGGPAGPKLPKR